MYFLFLLFIWVLGTFSLPSQIVLDAFPDSQFENHNNEPGFNLDLNALRLVQVVDGSQPEWLTEREKLKLKAAGIGFLDITDTPYPGLPKERYTYPNISESKATKIVTSIIANLSTNGPKANLERFSGFRTRYYNSATGKASSEWLASKIVEYVEQYETEDDERNITVALLQHAWLQNSVVVRITSKNATDSDPITIVGAHCDSINHVNPYLPAPGADDDGSGSVAILEALRGILQSGYTPTSPIEFHFYAGEEGGLLGSLAIASSYDLAGKSVRGMEQFDTIAWVRNGTEEAIAVYYGHVDDDLTEFQKRLIEKYLKLPWVESAYPGTAASDHFSWTRYKYPACHVTEAPFENMNKNLHSPNDTITISPEFSFGHLLEYSKLAVAFAVELSNY